MKASPTASTYATSKMGFARAGVHTDIFRSLFQTALGEPGWQAEYDKFQKKMQMPPVSETDAPRANLDDFFALWTFSTALAPDYVGLDEAFAQAPVDSVACVESISHDMDLHVAKMAEEGWMAKNASKGWPMFACEAGKCFEQVDAGRKPRYPEVQTLDFGKKWVPAGTTQKMRYLRTLAGPSSYWMRSSADGRFVGNGEATTEGDEGQSTIEDLLLKDRPRISVTASYDPGFFPDNNGWTFHGINDQSPSPVPVNDGATFCSQRLLEDPTVKTVQPNHETRFCSSSKLSVYQHVGASLDGSGYFVMRSDNYTNDNGAYDVQHDPSVVSFATADSTTEIWPMQASAETFTVANEPIVLNIPFEGDWSIAPSATISASRIASGASQEGYRIRKFEGTGANIKLKDIATVCMPGGKATFSYNERFMAVHHYVDAKDFAELGFASAQDPAFVKLVENSSNVFVYDFVKRTRTRVSNMQPGQFALYPHFRSDGWMYFLVRDTVTGKNHVIASDIAQQLSSNLQPL